MFVPTELLAAFAAAVLVLCAIAVLLFLLRRGRPSYGEPAAEALARLEGRLSELGDISSRVEELAAIFTVPRTRGEVGETVLAELLATYLPSDAYALQHSFADGGRVDAVISLGESLVPIDAKFPLEALRKHQREHPEASELPASIRRSFVSHARAISERYIRPEEGTMNFALMYVPSEGVYYRVFVADPGETMREALALRVIPVSPGTLFLYLLTVSYGLRGLAFSRERSELLAAVSAVRREFDEVTRAIELLRGHLKNASKAADDCDSRLAKLDRGLNRLEE